jgi:hypothetical protein
VTEVARAEFLPLQIRVHSSTALCQLQLHMCNGCIVGCAAQAVIREEDLEHYYDDGLPRGVRVLVMGIVGERQRACSTRTLYSLTHIPGREAMQRFSGSGGSIAEEGLFHQAVRWKEWFCVNRCKLAAEVNPEVA